MNKLLCVSIRFLDPLPSFHGRSGDGEPEWPPSPLRLFQALVSAASNLWREDLFHSVARPALQWLERIQPAVVAPQVAPESFGYRMYVPNNSGDLMTSAWARGDTDTTMSKFRVEKDVRPKRLGSDAIHFLFQLPNDKFPYFETLRATARSVTHLGWGIDMVSGNAEMVTEEQAKDLLGEVWRATSGHAEVNLRIPKLGTLDALVDKHQKFLGRLSADGFKPVPPLSAFRIVGYRRATETADRPFAAFSLLKPDASAMRSFDTLRKTREVAGMLRHSVAAAARDQGWSDVQINVFVHGKVADGSTSQSSPACPDRFHYLPLPTINHALGRVESIRRVIIAAPPHCDKQTSWARRAMSGAELINRNEVSALLTILPQSDWVLRQYVNESVTWSTVTPVILPGYDDPDHLRRKLKKGVDVETQQRYLARLGSRVDELLRKAFRQAGYSHELVDQLELDWREVGFRAGVELASRYLPPENLNNAPRLHVRVRFPNAVRGPIAVGSGRFRGFGLMVAD